jgi:hypothetical protein
MEREIGGNGEAGVWLAVTSISFDISVLELFWTLARGYKVVIADEESRLNVTQAVHGKASQKAMELSLFYFAADGGGAGERDAYRVLLEGARYADENGFAAVWTPERHFHADFIRTPR